MVFQSCNPPPVALFLIDFWRAIETNTAYIFTLELMSTFPRPSTLVCEAQRRGNCLQNHTPRYEMRDAKKVSFSRREPRRVNRKIIDELFFSFHFFPYFYS